MADKELDTITTPNFNAEIEDAVAKKHTQGTDQTLDSGGANEVAVADVKDAVTKKHTQNTDTELGALTADINLNAHKILEFATPVTTKTTTDTLTVAEAGLIKVSAASAYTLTLPTAVGHEGLTYHFVKTDANYNLITLDANGTETFNFPNDDGVPKETYTRLNTYCAEVTVVSDGANWQCINEKMGQVPKCYVYLSSNQLNFTSGVVQFVDFDTKSYDIGNNFNTSVRVSGTATSTSAGHLVDSAGAFTADMNQHRIKNTTDSTYTYITAVNSATDVSVRDDIFVNGEGYELRDSKFVAPIGGRYLIQLYTAWTEVVADTLHVAYIHKNGEALIDSAVHSAIASWTGCMCLKNEKLAKDDYCDFWVYNNSGVNTEDLIASGTRYTRVEVRLLSKE